METLKFRESYMLPSKLLDSHPNARILCLVEEQVLVVV